MLIAVSFVAGFLSTLLFHQGLLALFFIAGLVPAAPYSMAPTEPLGVPQVFSLAFWGGVWGILLWLAIRNRRGLKYWALAVVLGAIGPTAVAMGIVFPLKGIPVDGMTVVGGLILNGFWGLGTGLFILAWFVAKGWVQAGR
jgi:hypothetical protein